MTFETAAEAEKVFNRIKQYLDLSGLKSADEMNQREQLQKAIENSRMEHVRNLSNSDLAKSAVNTPSIRSELIKASKSSYQDSIYNKGFENVKEGKIITISKGRLKGYQFVQFRGTREGKSTIAGNFYLKKKE